MFRCSGILIAQRKVSSTTLLNFERYSNTWTLLSKIMDLSKAKQSEAKQKLCMNPCILRLVKGFLF